MRAREPRRQQLPACPGSAAGPRRARHCAPHAGGARAHARCGAVLAGGRFAGTARLRAAGSGGGRPHRVAISGPRGCQRERLGARDPRLAQTAARARDAHPAGAPRCPPGPHPRHRRGQGGRRGEGETRRSAIGDDCGRTMADRPRGGRGQLKKIEVVPSILSADVTRLGDQVREAVAARADRIQVDVMDGHFVPNLTFGPLVVEAVRKVTDLPIEAHLMVERPDLFIEAFAKAGASLIEVQVEATTSLYRAVQAIKELGADAGVAINPATSVEALREILPYISLVNVMTVEPGFGGQKFIVHSPEKIRRLRVLAPEMEIEVDGGIDAQTAPLVAKAGATVLVAGNAVFGHRQGVAAGIKAIRDALD